MTPPSSPARPSTWMAGGSEPEGRAPPVNHNRTCALTPPPPARLHPPAAPIWRGNQMRCMACGEEMRLIQAVADDTMAVPGFEQHLYRCPGCNDTEQRLAFVHPDDPAPRRVAPIAADASDVTLAPAAQPPGEHEP